MPSGAGPLAEGIEVGLGAEYHAQEPLCFPRIVGADEGKEVGRGHGRAILSQDSRPRVQLDRFGLNHEPVEVEDQARHN